MPETNFEFSSEALFKIPLIPDEREFKEQMIDAYLEWIAANDPNSPLKNPDMVEGASEIQYLQNRQEELERDREWMIHQRLFQHQREVTVLEKATSPVSEVGPAHQVQARQQQWIDQEIAKLEKVCDHDVKLIAGRFNTLMRQCSDRIANAQARYDEAYHRSQVEKKKNDVKGTG